MKALLRGRAIDIELDGNPQQVAAKLVDRGLEAKLAQSVAAEALRAAAEETDRLRRQLIPQTAWPGSVLCCRHCDSGQQSWLLLKMEGRGWNLNAALFE